MALSKLLDQSPRLLNTDFGIATSWNAYYLMQMHEEWFQSLVPLIFSLALIFWSRTNKSEARQYAPQAARNR